MLTPDQPARPHGPREKLWELARDVGYGPPIRVRTTYRVIKLPTTASPQPSVSYLGTQREDASRAIDELVAHGLDFRAEVREAFEIDLGWESWSP